MPFDGGRAFGLRSVLQRDSASDKTSELRGRAWCRDRVQRNPYRSYPSSHSYFPTREGAAFQVPICKYSNQQMAAFSFFFPVPKNKKNVLGEYSIHGSRICNLCAIYAEFSYF